ncbi:MULTISPECIES: hypothetical protein [Acinetobacter]|uniref:phage tail fiber protein n=1 Tax=Acinetobacter TaxID=469 RepID=UPI0002CF63A2|nr:MULTISPECIES: hypothetical protein [Acinetobacter]ENX29116.1 hypothetical protein F890_02218 [Acinetobacter sp. CIP 64.7]
MAKQTINQGIAPTGAGGDTFRSGSAKLQANDDEIYSQLGANTQGVLPAALPVNKGGTGATTAAAARTNLGLGTAATYDVGTSENQLLKVFDFGLGKSNQNAFNNNPSGFSYNALAAISPIGMASSVITAVQGGRGFRIAARFVSAAIETWNDTEAANQILVLWHSKNTTVDSNGFVKRASPIVQLFADKIELNDEAGQQEITFEKLGVGEYLIKGSSGFAQEGWYIETPKDANGNVLFSVIYTTLENGDISVKTYKKKFDFETVSIVADLDNPVDITEGRWIDLRLQELPQPEIEEPESMAPPEFQPTGLAEAVATVMESYHDPEQ